MKKGVLVIKFEDEKITVRTMGVSGSAGANME